MTIRADLAIIAGRLEAIEKIFRQYSNAESAAEERNEQQQSSQKFVRAEITFDNTSKREAQTEADRQHRTQNAIRWTAFGAFAAAIFYAGISGLMFHEMHVQTAQLFRQGDIENAGASHRAAETSLQLNNAKRQADAAQKNVNAIQQQMRVDQRAWVSVATVGSDLAQPLQFLETKVEIRNTGKTPAKNLSFIVMPEIREKGSIYAQYPPHPPLVPYAPLGVELWGFHSHGVVAPNASISQTSRILAHPGVLLPDEAAGLDAGWLILYVHGRIEYTDIFNRLDWTTFCFFSNPTPSPLLPGIPSKPQPTVMEYSICPSGNDMDRNQ